MTGQTDIQTDRHTNILHSKIQTCLFLSHFSLSFSFSSTSSPSSSLFIPLHIALFHFIYPSFCFHIPLYIPLPPSSLQTSLRHLHSHSFLPFLPICPSPLVFCALSNPPTSLPHLVSIFLFITSFLQPSSS